jgi:sirohydrochlorin cobaltochelatase
MSRALVVVGHGSHFSAASSAPVHAAVRTIRQRGAFDEVRPAFWKEEPSLSRAFDGLQSDDITVVPFFISSGYFTAEVIPREMRLDGRITLVYGRTIRYTEPIGAHPGLANVILQRAHEAGASDGEALAVLGHGTPRNPDSERNVYLQSERVAAMNVFPEVATIFLEQEPNMRDVFQLVKSESVVVVPLFVADGWHVGETIPEDLALDGAETRRDGRRLVYAGAAGTHPMVADVILELAEEAARW